VYPIGFSDALKAQATVDTLAQAKLSLDTLIYNSSYSPSNVSAVLQSLESQLTLPTSINSTLGTLLTIQVL
jgi:hypothetical protein